MTRRYVAKKLLELGPLTFAEFVEITGWPLDACLVALRDLVKRGEAFFLQPMGQRRRLYFAA